MTRFDKISIAKIAKEDRIRKDLGDLDVLAKSIASHGLLNPITVTKQNEEYLLLAGERRLEACKILRMKEIDVHIIELQEVKA